MKTIRIKSNQNVPIQIKEYLEASENFDNKTRLALFAQTLLKKASRNLAMQITGVERGMFCERNKLFYKILDLDVDIYEGIYVVYFVVVRFNKKTLKLHKSIPLNCEYGYTKKIHAYSDITVFDYDKELNQMLEKELQKVKNNQPNT